MRRLLHLFGRRALKRGESLLYRMAGLPITIAALLAAEQTASASVRRYYAHHYWAIDSIGDCIEIVAAAILWLPLVLGSALYFTCRNGPVIHRRSGISPFRQFLDQLYLSLTRGVLPPWYYILALYRPERREHCSGFLNRCETKRGAYPVLTRARSPASPLNDKFAFARHCSLHQLPTISVLAIARDGEIEWIEGAGLPACDLFLKPMRACGGTGAERWDYAGQHCYRRPGARAVSAKQLLAHICRRGTGQPMLVQQRMRNHTALRDLTNGALATVRMLSCLDEHERPETVAAVFRMGIGRNCTVDNIHAGGIASRVNLANGVLSSATDLGINARLGDLWEHPDTRAKIAGRVLPDWEKSLDLACRAHSAFCDRVMIGWDIALLDEGPIIVEGNSGPDVDLMQRHGSTGLGQQRFGELLAWHLERGEADWAKRNSQSRPIRRVGRAT